MKTKKLIFTESLTLIVTILMFIVILPRISIAIDVPDILGQTKNEIPIMRSTSGSALNWADNISSTSDTWDEGGTITTALELAQFAYNVNQDRDYSGQTIRLEEDIDLSPLEWTPIGIGGKSFKGSFNGNNKKISGIKIGSSDNPKTGLDMAGLFGGVGSEGLITNLGVKVEIYSNLKISIGGLVASNYGKIENSYAEALITNNGTQKYSYIGGLVGINNAESIVSNSYASCNIIGGDFTRNGGLVGQNEGEIINSHAEGKVTGGGTSNIGGLVGLNKKGIILNSYTTANVKSIKNAFIGGFVGVSNEGTITNCFSRATITKEGTPSNIGGLLGYNQKSKIRKSYWDSEISGFDLIGVGLSTESMPENDVTEMTSEEMKDPKFVTILNLNLDNLEDTRLYKWQAVEGDYPIFSDSLWGLSPQSLYTASFFGGTDAIGTEFTQSVTGGSIEFTLPTNIFTKTGYIFSGWNDGLKTYGQGEKYTMPSKDVTFTAEWTNKPGSETIDESENNEKDNPKSRPLGFHSSSSIPESSYGSEINRSLKKPSSPADIFVNGKIFELAGSVETKEKGRTIVRVTIDENKLNQKLEKEANNLIMTIFLKRKLDVIICELNGQMLKNMENKEAVIEIKTDEASYILPAHQININAISGQFARDVKLKDIKVAIEVSKLPQETAGIVENLGGIGEISIIAPLFEFKIISLYQSKTIDVNKFSSYVERIIGIPEGLDQTKITTGVIIDSEGRLCHVPTKFIVDEGKHYGKINSLTNSIYSLIYNSVTFTDVENHWAKEAIDDMASRMVIKGLANNNFNPEGEITRAEFVAIIVRALGLNPEVGLSAFSDVKKSDWYRGYIKTAFDYNIILGDGKTKFRPNDKINREEAMTMIARAMDITALKSDLKDRDIKLLLKKFTDERDFSHYARESIGKCLETGIIQGRKHNQMGVKDFMTRGEAAVIVQRLLEKSNLI